MRKCVLALIMMTLPAWQSYAQTSAVFSCHFTDEINPLISLRMKDYFDEARQMKLGKVDVLVGLDVKESTPTQVLEVPIWESDTYIKMWFASSLRVEAQLSWSSSSREFSAVYVRNSTRRPIYCTKMTD